VRPRVRERLRSLLWRVPVATEVREEIRFHLDMIARDLEAQGMPREDARREAERRFGDPQALRGRLEGLGASRDRAWRLRGWIEDARHDVAYALRQVAARPGFAGVTVATLALGIGGCVALFSVLRAVVLRPLPFPQAERIYQVATDYRGDPGAVSIGNLLALQAESRAFTSLAAHQGKTFNLADEGEPERVRGARVGHEYFEVLGVPAALGRVFGRDEDQPGRDPVVVLSHRLWVRRFGADPAVVGRAVRLGGIPHQVVGVMPASFEIPLTDDQLWIPVAFSAKERVEFDAHYLTVLGRLAPGATDADARAEMARLGPLLQRLRPRENDGRVLRADPLLEQVVGEHRRRLVVLMAAVGLVLLIACVNVASLLLARGAARARELAVRSALGAGGRRLVRQLLTETAVLAAAGGTLGLALAAAAVRGLVTHGPADVPRLADARLDGSALAAALGLTVMATLAAGLIPALRAARVDAAAGLGLGGRSGSFVRDRLRRGLVVAEVAVAVMLLNGAALVLVSARNLAHVAPGFDPAGLLSVRVALPARQYPGDELPAALFERVVERLRSAPGVAEVAASTRPPLIGDLSYGFLPEGRTDELKSRVQTRLQLVTPGYLEALRLRLLEGRTLRESDRAGAPRVMVVSDVFARAAFPGQNAIGKRIACCEQRDGQPVWKEIVGVVGATRARGPAEDGAAEAYMTMAQSPQRGFDAADRSVTLIVRPRQGAPEAMVGAVREAVRAEDPALPLYDVATMSARLEQTLAPARFSAALLAALGLVGLFLAAIGLYGVISYLIGQRTQEIGVRLALGANRRDVVLLGLREGLRSVVTGVALGAAGCLLQAPLLERLLFGVAGRDVATLAAVSGVLLVVGLAASAIPASRAARIEPRTALA
jgi:putative ABC transport system permease protein